MKTELNYDDPLQKQFKTLEIEWDSIKKSFSRSTRRSSGADHHLFQLSHNSPKELMSLLQLDNESVSSGDCDRAAVEVIEQRTVDFDNGRLKGRRLFEDSDGDEQSEVSTEFSCKGFENYDEKCGRVCVDSPERGVAVVAVKGGGHGGGCVGRLMVCVVVMLALAIVVFKCGGEDEQVLVPT